MSYELVNPSTAEYSKFSRQFWAKALELARLYGWQPMGTRLAPKCNFPAAGVDWLGTYLTNDGQRVTAEDAFSLAAALERSLNDISDVRVAMEWDFSAWLEDGLPEWLSPMERELVEDELQDGLLDVHGTNPLEFFAGDEKRLLVHLIRFCRLGGFEIL